VVLAPASGAIAFALVPAAIVVAAVVGLKEAPSKRRSTGVLLSVCGVAIVVATGESGSASPAPLLGAAFMLGAVAAWAAYTVLAKQLAGTDQVVVIACVSVIGMAMVLPAAAVGAVSRPMAASLAAGVARHAIPGRRCIRPGVRRLQPCTA